CAISASMSCDGMPAVPKPPIMTVDPSCMSATACSAEAAILSIIRRLLENTRSTSDAGGGERLVGGMAAEEQAVEVGIVEQLGGGLVEGQASHLQHQRAVGILERGAH